MIWYEQALEIVVYAVYGLSILGIVAFFVRRLEPVRDWLMLPARFYLGYIFIYACIHKIAHPGSFALDIATYDIIPLGLVNIMAVTLPWIELFAGVLLIAGYKTRGAALAVAGMMVMFIVAIMIALSKGLDMSCGCFASQSAAEEDPISAQTILRDSGWLFLSLYVFLLDRNPIGIDSHLTYRKKMRNMLKRQLDGGDDDEAGDDNT